jgi:hypothetical protein
MPENKPILPPIIPMCPKHRFPLKRVAEKPWEAEYWYCTACAKIPYRNPTEKTKTNKPTLPEVIPLVLDYYAKEGNCAGGNLHIVLDDGNLQNSSIEYCLKCAEEENDVDGVVLAKLLLLMSHTQRKHLYRMNKLNW